MQEIIDTHCHIDDTQFDPDRDTILGNCRALGINKIIVPAIQRSNWDTVLDLCRRYDALYPALGLHPLLIDAHSETDLDELRSYLQDNKVIAIGEIGLDYYDKHADRDKQQYFLDQQLLIAEQFCLPALLHVRKAHADMIKSLKNHHLHRGIAHAFNGSLEQAREYIKLGYKLGFGGVITYENATRIRTLARELPLDAIVLETDAPDMAGVAHKGQRNSPEYITDALAALAEIREQSEEQISIQTTRNAYAVFGDSIQASYAI